MANEVVIHVKGDAKDAEKSIQSFTDRIKASTADLTKLGAGLLGFGAALTAGLTLAVKSAAEEEAGIAKLSQALKNVGVSYDAVKVSLEANIEATQQKTAIADDQQRDALQKLIEVTGNYNSALGLMPLTLDLAAAKGMDFGMAAEVIGRVAAGNVTILSRYGIQLKEGATATEALAALTQKFGGQAEKMGNTVAGQMKLLKANFGDAAEALGATLLPVISKITETLNNLVLWFKGLSPETKRIIAFGTAVGGAFTVLGGTFLLLLTQLPSIILGFKALAVVGPIIGAAFHAALGPIGIITASISAAIAIGILLARNWDTVKRAVQIAVNAILGAVEGFSNGAIRGFNAVIRGINAFSSAISFGAIPAIKEIAEIHLPRLEVSVKKAAKGGEKAAEGFKTSFENASEDIKANLQKVTEQADKFGGQLLVALKARNKQMEETEKETIEKTLDAVKDGTDDKIRIYERERDVRRSIINGMRDAAIDASNSEVAEVRRTTGEKITQYQREAAQKLAAFLGPGTKRIKGLQEEIDKINELQRLEDVKERFRNEYARQKELMGRIEDIQAKIRQQNIKENMALGRNDFAEAKKAAEDRKPLYKELQKAEEDLTESKRLALVRVGKDQQDARKTALQQNIQSILDSQAREKVDAADDLKRQIENEENKLTQTEKSLAKVLKVTTENFDKQLSATQEHYEKQKKARLSALDADLKAITKHYKTLNTEESLQGEALKLIVDNSHAEIIAILDSYNPKWQDAGRSFGQNLIEGLESEKARLSSTVASMLALVAQTREAQSSVGGGATPTPTPTPTPAPVIITPAESLARAVQIAQGFSIPAFQGGGLVLKPTLALLGEKGPEAVVPLGGPSPLAPINITVSIFNRGIIGLDDLDKHIFQAIRDGKRRGAFQGVIA